MKLKRGVRIDKLCLSLFDLLPTIERCFNAYESILVITSGNEGDMGDKVHMPSSKHYVGEAIDCRSRHLNQQTRKAIVGRLRYELPSLEYDVVEEETHIHIEYDPKDVR